MPSAEDHPAPVAPAAGWQLRLIAEQTRRTPYALVAADLFIGWLFLRHGWAPWVAAWFVVITALHLGRARHLGRLVERRPAGERESWRAILGWFLAVGCARTVPILSAARLASAEEQYLLTIIHVGLAAGGVASVAGVVRAYLAWALPVAASLIVLWLLHGSLEGRWIAVLLALMFMLLTAYVRDQGRALAHQVELTERLQVAVKARARFFAAASHDLRQPLGVLRWYGDAVTLHARRLQHDALAKIGEGIVRAVAHAEPLVRTYLEIARFEAGAMQSAPEDIEVTPLLQEVCQAYAHDAQERGLVLTFEIGMGTGALQVHADRRLLRSVLDNLTGNALKFTPAGRVTLAAVPAARDGSPHVRLEVRDTGIGVAPADQERIFEDFVQVANPQRSRSQGVGLGLAIARRQCQLMGATLRIDSQLGRGSVFSLELPCTCAPEASAAAAAARSADIPPRRVLLIDDEPEVRQSLSMLLESAQWHVRAVDGPAAALAQWRAGFVPDVILLDYRLTGDLTGTEAQRQLQAAGVAAPFVFVTGDTAPERLRDLSASGCEVVHKPVALDELVEAVERSLRPRTRSA